MEEQRKYLTEEELARFLKVIPSIRDRAIFAVLYWRGLRASEVGLLRMASVRMSAGRIFVERCKGSEGGEFPMSPDELRALKAWLRVRGQEPGPLFPSRNSTPISRGMLHVLMKKYGEKAGIPSHLRHCHALKHSIGTHLIGKGAELFAVKDWLGHKDIKSTMEYVRFRSKQRDRIASEIYTRPAE